MSVASTVRRNGIRIIWRKMLGEGGAYDFNAATVAAAYAAPVEIYGVLDGFGSVESQLSSEHFRDKELSETGDYRVFTTTRISAGDTMEFDSEVYTVLKVKAVWKKARIVLFMAAVEK